MKRARFTDEQIFRILQEADKSQVEVAKRYGVSEPSSTPGARSLAIWVLTMSNA